MTHPFRRTLRAYAADARAAFRSAPVEVALGLALAVLLSIHVRNRGFTDDEFARVAASVALAFPLVFALSVLAARGVVSAPARWAGTAAVLVACTLFGLTALHDGREADGWRWALLAAAAVLLLALTAVLPWRPRERRRTWAFAWRLAVRVVGVGLYAVALYGILAGAAAAVISLFELRRPDHLFTDLAGAVFFGFAPWIFVGGIGRLVAPAEEGVPEGVSRLGRWLYAPVLVIYLAVLYAYAAKVGMTGELPRNLVSPLVIAAGLIGLLGGALLEPVHGDDEHRGLSLLVRAVPALLLPLVPLAFWALAARLGEYGWTEFRYVRLAAVVTIGILAVLGTVRLVRKRPPLLSSIPAVFAAGLLLSALGPWSAPAVSRRDQTQRLRAALRQARIDPARLTSDTVRVESPMYERISSGAGYLLSAHGPGALREVIPTLPDTTRDVWQLGLRKGCTVPQRTVGELAWAGGVQGLAGGTMGAVEVTEARPADVVLGRARIRLALSGDRVRAQGDGWTAEGDLAALRALLQAHGSCDPEWERGAEAPRFAARDALVPLRDAGGAVRGQMVVTRIGVGTPAERTRTPQQPGVRVREVYGFLVLPP